MKTCLGGNVDKIRYDEAGKRFDVYMNILELSIRRDKATKPIDKNDYFIKYVEESILFVPEPYRTRMQKAISAGISEIMTIYHQDMH